jgi:hypothetical protein
MYLLAIPLQTPAPKLALADGEEGSCTGEDDGVEEDRRRPGRALRVGRVQAWPGRRAKDVVVSIHRFGSSAMRRVDGSNNKSMSCKTRVKGLETAGPGRRT